LIKITALFPNSETMLTMSWQILRISRNSANSEAEIKII